VLIDGQPAEVVPVADRGLHYGDGLFETIAVFHGRPCLWHAHMERLALGCQRLGIPLPELATLAAEAERLCSGVDQGVLKLIVTRGVGGRGYRLPAVAQPRRILALYPWPDYPDSCWAQGVTVRWCDTPLGLNPLLAGLKHCNRLEQVMARAEWDAPAIAEGLMCDVRGQVVEGTMSNLFVLKDGRLYTPPLEQCGVAGVVRGVVFELAAELGLSCQQAALSRDAVQQADALLLSNAVIGLWPVAELEGRPLNPRYWPGELMAAVMQRVRQP
jgi:4-amino-4-deoxychorismate lyase